MKWSFTALLLCLVSVATASTDEEVVEQLEHWLEEPLDLGAATAEQLALLPWLTSWEAEAIVGLREAGALRRWSDLSAIAGLDSDRVSAIEPFVQMPVAGRGWGSGRLEAIQRSQTHRTRRWGWGRWTGGFVQGALRWDEDHPSRGWVRGRWTTGEILAGDLLLDTGTTGSWSSSPDRSRTGPVGVPSGPRLRGGGLSSGWRGLALRQRSGPVLLLMGLDQEGRRLALAETAVGRRLRAGAAWLPGHDGPRPAAWLTGDGDVAWRTEVARDVGGPWRLAGAGTWRAAGWRAGLAMTHGGGTYPDAFDPITGQSLDRPHRAVQAHGGRLLAPWRLMALARRVWRGLGSKESVRDRTEWTVEGRSRGHAWQMRLRVDRPAGAPPEVVWSARWTEETGLGRRLRVRWGVEDGSTATLLAAGIQRGRRWRWQVWMAGAGGDRSSLWLTGVGGGPPLSQWLAPGGYAAVVGLGHDAPSGWTASLWAALEIDPEAGTQPQAGARIVARWRD